MKTVATFIVDGKVLTGREARKAWASQVVRCPCGYCSTPRRVVVGRVGMYEAVWLSCDNPKHAGQALGQPIVFRPRK